MFRQFARIPVRRCLHSQAGSSTRPSARYTRSVYALGALITVAGYVAWSSNSRHISPDSEAVSGMYISRRVGIRLDGPCALST